MLVADENVDSAIVRRLHDDGHDVVWIAESEPGIADDRVLAIAEEQSRVLTTLEGAFAVVAPTQVRIRRP